MPSQFAPADSLFSRHSQQLEELINKNVDTLLPTLDPAWRDTVVTSQGVGPASALGRDLKILKLYRGGLTGVIEQGAQYGKGDFALYGDDTTVINQKLYLQSATKTWPNALEGPAVNSYRLGIGMRSMLTNLAVTMGEMQAEATPAFIGDIIAPKLKGFAQNLSHTLCNYWYMSQNDGYRLAKISSDGVSLSGTAANGVGPWYCTFRPDNYAIDRFYVGQRVDILDGSSSSSVLNTRNRANGTGSGGGTTRLQVFVSAVDELRGYVTLASTTYNFTTTASGATAGSVTANKAAAAGDYIVYANSGSLANAAAANGTAQSFTGIAGINSWLKFGGGGDDNVLLGSERDTGNEIDVTVHPEFKSFGVSSVGTLTEHKLRQYVRRFHAAKNKYGQTIDCLIASDGVWLSYEAQKIGQYTLERQGKLSNVNSEGSDQGFKFTFEGRTYNGYTSTYIEDGVVYGIKKGGSNWKRYVPPDPKGVQKFSEADSFIPFNFVVPALTGTATTKFPILSGGLMTEAMQMPGMLRMQLVPDQAAGMKLSGVTTDRVWSST
jgi:hypothetical protein